VGLMERNLRRAPDIYQGGEKEPMDADGKVPKQRHKSLDFQTQKNYHLVVALNPRAVTV
jgi:hypothetical protein